MTSSQWIQLVSGAGTSIGAGLGVIRAVHRMMTARLRRIENSLIALDRKLDRHLRDHDRTLPSVPPARQRR